MATRKVIDCDYCNKEVPTATRLYVKVGSQTDVAGGPSEDIQDDIDLCPKHAGAALQLMLDSMDYEQGKNWLSKWKKPAKKGATA